MLLRIAAAIQLVQVPVAVLAGLMASEMSRVLSVFLLAAALVACVASLRLWQLRKWAWLYSLGYHASATPLWIVLVVESTGRHEAREAAWVLAFNLVLIGLLVMGKRGRTLGSGW